MTLAERFVAVTAFAKAAWWWIVVIALVVGALLMFRACRAESTAKAELLRYQEESRAAEAGLIVVHSAEKAALSAQLEWARKESREFAEAYDAASEALKARPVIVVRASTGPVPVTTSSFDDKKREVPMDPPDHMPAQIAPGMPAPATPPAPCLLSEGDQGEITITETVLQTEAGARVLVGAADAFRVTPEPRMRLFGGSFRTEITEAQAEPVPFRRSPGWGAGLAGGMATTGYLASALVTTPPILGHLEGVLELSIGPGLLAGQAGLIYRP